ncbi:MAG: hypothetical protein ACP5E4_00940 [Candidatus Aenigmatarchaeota archaeon]
MGDIDFHFIKLLGMSRDEFGRNITEIGHVLADSGADIVLTPDRGISLEVAKNTKNMGQLCGGHHSEIRQGI